MKQAEGKWGYNDNFKKNLRTAIKKSNKEDIDSDDSGDFNVRDVQETVIEEEIDRSSLSSSRKSFNVFKRTITNGGATSLKSRDTVSKDIFNIF